jgi:hypothetical protein
MLQKKLLKELPAVKTIPEIIGGAQALLDVRFDLSACFEESLTDKQKTFLKYFGIIPSRIPAYTLKSALDKDFSL